MMTRPVPRPHIPDQRFSGPFRREMRSGLKPGRTCYDFKIVDAAVIPNAQMMAIFDWCHAEIGPSNEQIDGITVVFWQWSWSSMHFFRWDHALAFKMRWG